MGITNLKVLRYLRKGKISWIKRIRLKIRTSTQRAKIRTRAMRRLRKISPLKAKKAPAAKTASPRRRSLIKKSQVRRRKRKREKKRKRRKGPHHYLKRLHKHNRPCLLLS